MPQWAPEIVVDEQLARRLLREQFPELPTRSLRLLASGWDNTVWVLDERWVVRFPRREVAVPLIGRELAVLQPLEPILPLRIPVPRFVGEPSEAFPWPFLGSELLGGRELGSAEVVAEEAVAVALGRFLQALHSRETLEAVPERDRLPEDPNARANMALRVPRTRELLAELGEQGLWRAPERVDALLRAAEALPHPGSRTLVHGDLHFRHVLVEQGDATGVIDWGDVCLADAGVDLQLGWSFFGRRGREAFLEEYGEVPPEREARARVLGLSLNAHLALYGHAEALPDVERAALASLDRVASS